ncbi:hypothetical protein L208DRAFT_1402249 [Tricholoma matsutake]|nr:hypothetical protein L208DRAFT_1402249 [Tricholoma matsutake 945]
MCCTLCLVWSCGADLFFFFFLQLYYVFSLLIFGLATYLSLNVGLSMTQTISTPSNPPD